MSVALPTEASLVEKLRRIEALFAGATTDGERIAADVARQRIQARLQQFATQAAPVEYRFKLADAWSRRLFLALLRRYGVHPYRRKGQRRTTVMARLPKRFVDETLWPEFEQLSKTLRQHLDDITERIISEVIHQNSTDPEEGAEVLLLK